MLYHTPEDAPEALKDHLPFGRYYYSFKSKAAGMGELAKNVGEKEIHRMAARTLGPGRSYTIEHHEGVPMRIDPEYRLNYWQWDLVAGGAE